MSNLNKKMIMTEQYNLRKIAYLYDNLDTFGPIVYSKCKNDEELNKEIDKLKQFLEYVVYHDGTIKVIYETDKDGRLFGQPYTIQMISGVVRNFLLEGEKLADIDIVNSVSAILLSVCNKHGIECIALKNYYNNRQKYIDEYYEGSKDKCKEFVNPSFFKDASWIKPTNKFERLLTKDIAKIQDFVFEHPDYAKYREHAEKTTKKDNSSNVKGRTLSYLYFDLETEIIKKAMDHYKKETKKQITTYMFDGFLVEKVNTFKLSKLNKLIKEYINSDIKFIYKPIENNHIPDIPEDYEPNIQAIKQEHKQNQLLGKPLPKFNHEPTIEGNEIYLSNIFKQEMYENNDIIVLQSCCGTGKTYSVAKYVAEANDKIISIVNRKSLLTAQIKEFNNKGVKLNNYENKDTYDLKESGIICINSIMKYANESDAHFKDFVIYIDEVNSFLETVSHSPILTKDIKLVYETLIRMVKNCKKIIVSDHTITDAVFFLLNSAKKKKNKRTCYVKNNYQKFKGVKAKRIRSELTFKRALENALRSNIGFFSGFDSARTASQYYHSMKHLTKCECILVTDETRVKIPADLSEWEGKCVFYSPKIETGIDFTIDTKQQVFFHMKGQSVLPTSSFQMICRTRNMEKLTWYAEKAKKHSFKYKSLHDCYNKAQEHKQNTNLYMCSTYMNENDDIVYAPNSFYNIYLFNEYTKDVYEHNKGEHLATILEENGFDCEEDVTEVEEKLDRVETKEMKSITDDAIEEIFEKWINDDVECEMYDIRSSMLGLESDDQKITYKKHITNRQTFEDHNKLILLLKEKTHIMSKADNALENSYAEFGIKNIYSKINLLSEFEEQTNIKRFDTTEAKSGTLKDDTWKMVQKLFRKTTKKPTTDKDIKKEYASLINNIVGKLCRGKRTGSNKDNNVVYEVDKTFITTSFNLDFEKITADNPTKHYDTELLNRLGLQMPQFETDNFGNIILDDE